MAHGRRLQTVMLRFPAVEKEAPALPFTSNILLFFCCVSFYSGLNDISFQELTSSGVSFVFPQSSRSTLIYLSLSLSVCFSSLSVRFRFPLTLTVPLMFMAFRFSFPFIFVCSLLSSLRFLPFFFFSFSFSRVLALEGVFIEQQGAEASLLMPYGSA